MEDCARVKECDLSFEIVKGGVVGVEEVGDTEVESGSGAIEELLA